MGNLRRKLPPLSSLVPFEAAARLQSFSRAGQELHLTQAAVSRQIRSLEENLGVQLFDRKSRGVFLTEAGEQFRQTITQALSSIAIQAERLRAREPGNSVVLSSQLVEAFYLLMPELAGLHERHPHLELKLSATLSPIGEAQEAFDIAVQTVGRSNGDHALLFSAPDQVFPVCSPHYLQSIEHGLSIDKLASYRLLHYETQRQDFVYWDQWLESANLPLRVGRRGMRFNSFPVMMQAAIEGHGIALGWELSTRRMLDNGTLVRPFGSQWSVPDALGVYKWQANTLSPMARLLVQWLKELLLARRPH